MSQVRRPLLRGVFAAAVLVVLQGCAADDVVTGQGSSSPTGSATTVDPASPTSVSGTGSAPATTSSGPAVSPTSSAPATTTSAAPASQTYRNETYGFSLTVPPGFTQTTAVGAGRGMGFQGPGGATLHVYGSDNLHEETAGTVCLQQGEGMGDQFETDTSGNRCTLRVSADGTRRVLVNWVGTGSLNTVDLSYPSSAAADLETTLKAVVGSFTPGDLTAKH